MAGKNTLRNLPIGWIWARIDDVTQKIDKISPADDPNTEFFYFDISSIDNTKNRVSNPLILEGREAPSRARQLVSGGDVLFSTVRPYLKNIALVPETYKSAVASTGFSVLRGEFNVLSKYIFYYVISDEFIDDIKPLQRGSSYPAVRDIDVKNQYFPLAPLAEQKRIVEEIEAQFSRLDSWLDTMYKLRDELPRLRASILKAAVEGRLVPQNPNDEPADILLQRILDERRRQWEENYLGDLKVKGKPAPKDDKWKEKYPEPFSPQFGDSSNIVTLPNGWIWASLSQLSANEKNSITDGPFGSNLKTSDYTSTGVRVIRLQNIGDGEFLNDDRVFISYDHYSNLKKHQIFFNDIVIATLGENLPRACIIPENIGIAIVKADCVRFKPNFEIILTEYLNIALNTQTVKKIALNKTHGLGRSRLNLKELKSLPIPVPPYLEQSYIVNIVNEKLLTIDRLFVLIEINIKRAEKMRQSVLKQAFEGKLVEQDPDDEPASELLKRIRIERELRAEEQKNNPKPKGKKREAKMTTKTERKSLYDTLKDAEQALQIAELFRLAEFSPETIDDFYEELRKIEDMVEFLQQNDYDVLVKVKS